MSKTIRVKERTYQKLCAIQDNGETIDDVIKRLISIYVTLETIQHHIIMQARLKRKEVSL